MTLSRSLLYLLNTFVLFGPKKSRKKNKGGFKVIEEGNFTKKNTRWKQNKSKYNSLKMV